MTVLDTTSQKIDPRKVYADALVWDMIWPIFPEFGNDWGKLDRIRAAGYNLLSVTLAGDNHNIGQACAMVGDARRAIQSRPDALVHVLSVADARRAKREGKLGVALHFEGTRCFERNLDMIELFYALGVRHNLLAFNQTNSCGGGCAEKDDGGLSNFGRSVVREMNRVGMLLDLSHTGRRTGLEALEISEKPAVFTHSNSDTLHRHYRNLTDEQVKAAAASGGLVGVSGASIYLGDPACSTASIFRHLDYFVQLVGPRHVGLGLDIMFDPSAVSDWIRNRVDEWPEAKDPSWGGFNYAMPEQVLELTGVMLDNGYAVEDVTAILGGNYERICSEVWK
jgi:membrane dipeptidase